MSKIELNVSYTTINGNNFCVKEEFTRDAVYLPYHLSYQDKQLTDFELKTVGCDKDMLYSFILYNNYLKKILLHKNKIRIYCDNIKIFGSSNEDASIPSAMSKVITFYC